MLVDILEAVPAAGKTATILEEVAYNNNNSVIASISRQLSRQSYEYYQSLGGMDAVIVDSDNRGDGSMSVAQTVLTVMKLKPRVIFITHSSLTQYVDLRVFEGYDLYIDEVPDLISLNRMKFTTNADHVLKYCNPVGNGIHVMYPLSVSDEMVDELDSTAKDGLHRCDDIAERLMPVYRCLLRGHPVMYRKDEHGSNMFFIEDYTNLNWEVFSSITIACANFAPTLTGYVLKHWAGWEFRDSHLKERLTVSKYPNTERVQISVMVDQNWSRYVSDKIINNECVYNILQKKIETMFPDGGYSYTTNSYRSRMSGNQIPYNPHGLNMYSDETDVVALFSYNPQPWQIPILTQLATIQGMEENGLIDAFLVSKYLEPVFQLCTRGDIRNIKSTKDIKMVVPDMRAAEYLKKNYLPNAIINRDDQLLVQSDTAKDTKDFNWKKNGISCVLEMSPQERRAFYYQCKKDGKKSSDYSPIDTKDLLYVKTWLTDYRNKKKK